MSKYRSLVRFAAVLAAASLPIFAGSKTVTPEPSLVVMMAVGVGVIVLVARKKRDR